ncbi:RNA polymerase sigma factor [Thiohalobacter sp. IOR34]|uniref:RNA polymerase sigma factor n=1 Tax=Thiohalobacter sp. IOR34 TaxID=3057176 RepID=UPI0025B0CAC4|nr:RNA polymerase sigma factor [Thiohalobacter sp. IOR34]WJW75670.1 RNA polymerase sigma factor [Thiohalobacter sp. IOR34]
MSQSNERQSELERFLAGVEGRAFRMAEFATGNREDALEIVQDAMFKLVQRYGERGREDWPPLFHRILQSRINDWHRRRSVRRRWLAAWGDRRAALAEEGPEPEFADPHAVDPPGRLAQGEAMAAVHAAVQALPLRQQQAFLLRIWEGLDVAQTAYAMGCSEGSVKTHLSRAMAKLRERLGEHWP